VARSCTDAEYRALATATLDIVWIKSLFDVHGVTLREPPLHFVITLMPLSLVSILLCIPRWNISLLISILSMTLFIVANCVLLIQIQSITKLWKKFNPCTGNGIFVLFGVSVSNLVPINDLCLLWSLYINRVFPHSFLGRDMKKSKERK
jgi:hypothetical protein